MKIYCLKLNVFFKGLTSLQFVANRWIASKAWGLKSARWAVSELNYHILRHRRASLPVESARLGIHFNTSWTLCMVKRWPFKYGCVHSAAHTIARHCIGQCRIAFQHRLECRTCILLVLLYLLATFAGECSLSVHYRRLCLPKFVYHTREVPMYERLSTRCKRFRCVELVTVKRDEGCLLTILSALAHRRCESCKAECNP